jgi:acetyl esterase/lipase
MTTQEKAYRYAHYATPDPDFDKYKDMENPFANSEGLSVPAMREIMAHMPVTFPYDQGDVASVAISHETIKARDGAELNLRIYRAKDVRKDAVLFFVTHGGGTILSWLSRVFC